MLGLIRDNWLKLLCAMGCMLLVAASTATTAFLVKPVLDDVFLKRM